MIMDEFERLVDMIPDDSLTSCIDVLFEAQRRYEGTPRPPRAYDRNAALWYAIKRGSGAPFKPTDAYYVFVWPLIILRHRSDDMKARVLEMIGRTIDRALVGTRPSDEAEYAAAQSVALEILISHTPDRIDAGSPEVQV